MAQQTVVTVVDDLDETVTEDVQTVRFAVDRVEYEIDLGKENRDVFYQGLADFLEVAHRVKPARRLASVPKLPAKRDREQTKAIREYARKAGHKISDRGRIPRWIEEEYEKAQGLAS